MPKTVITPPGTQTPIAPFSPGTLADGVVYVSGTLAFDKDNNVAHVGDAAAQTRQVLETIKSVVEAAGGEHPEAGRGGRRLRAAQPGCVQVRVGPERRTVDLDGTEHVTTTVAGPEAVRGRLGDRVQLVAEQLRLLVDDEARGEERLLLAVAQRGRQDAADALVSERRRRPVERERVEGSSDADGGHDHRAAVVVPVVEEQPVGADPEER